MRPTFLSLGVFATWIEINATNSLRLDLTRRNEGSLEKTRIFIRLFAGGAWLTAWELRAQSGASFINTSRSIRWRGYDLSEGQLEEFRNSEK